MVCEQNYRELSKLQSFFRFYCGWGGGKVKNAAAQGAFAKPAFRRGGPRLRRDNSRDWISKVPKPGEGSAVLAPYIKKACLVRGRGEALQAQADGAGQWAVTGLKGLKDAPIYTCFIPFEKCFNPSAGVRTLLEISGKVAEGFDF